MSECVWNCLLKSSSYNADGLLVGTLHNHSNNVVVVFLQ